MNPKKERREKIPPYKILPFAITAQLQDGCTTASARAVIPYLGIDFESQFLPKLSRYNLGEPEDNHMLGIVTIATELGLSTSLHTKDELVNNMEASNFPSKAEVIHPKVIDEIKELAKNGKTELLTGNLDKNQFLEIIKESLLNEQYIFLFIDWKKFNQDTQAKWGNPNHILVVVGFDGNKLIMIDPSIEKEENPVRMDFEEVYDALLPEQQIVFVGKIFAQ